MTTRWITDAPRVPLAFLPTPLVPLDRLSDALKGPRVWLKRDDCSGLATGGNKTRKLEYLLAHARALGADVVVTFGAIQSNHARQTAAACAVAGLPCHLVLSRRVRWPHAAYERAGNVLLDQLLGATVHFAEPDQTASATRSLLATLQAAGHVPYVIPTGGSNATGALGYARCALELAQQAREAGFELTDVMHASSSAGTQAGLVAGFAAMAGADGRPSPRVHGVNVYEPDADRLRERVLELTREVLATHAPSVQVEAADIRVDERYLGEDYGIPTPMTLEAIRLAARTEGVLMDPVYSGKGFSALIDRVRRGEFARVENLIFVHTGGTAVLGVYDTAFAGN
jgi:L-cysteate sulfo-lyase